MLHTFVIMRVIRGRSRHAVNNAPSHLDDDDVHLVDVQRLRYLLPAEADLGLVPGPRVRVQPAADAGVELEDESAFSRSGAAHRTEYWDDT